MRVNESDRPVYTERGTSIEDLHLDKNKIPLPAAVRRDTKMVLEWRESIDEFHIDKIKPINI